MVIVDRALLKREEQNNPIRVALVGAGFQGAAIVRQIATKTKGMRIVGVANRNIGPAARAFEAVGLEPTMTEGRTNIEQAIAAGKYVATEDAIGLVTADGVDVVVEVTGSVEYAALVVISAIEERKHVVQMNAELDGTVGPILQARAREAGVIYTFSDGDQPAVQMNLFRFVAGLGVKPVLCGNIKGLHDPYRNPATQQAFADKWGQKPAMVASFADGTKISFEQAVVANGTGFRVARRGMLGPDFSGGDPSRPLVPLEETVSSFTETLNIAEDGLVDYVVGARPGPGVFVLGTHDDPRQRHFLNLYKLGEGPYYCFSTPYHLCHFEVPFSIGRAVLFADETLSPVAGPKVGVIAMAKKNLEPGDKISEFGGFEAYGVAENAITIAAENLLPMGLAIGCTVRHRIRKDAALTMNDVIVPPDRLIDRLYREQSERFGVTRGACA